MDGALTKEEAAARWRRHLEAAEAGSRQTWPRDVTAGMSEFEWLTLAAEILDPVLGGLALALEEEAEELSINRTYTVILAAAAACNRWLKEELRPGLRGGGQDFETPMTLDPAADIDYWARERAKPLPEEPDSDGDIEAWLHWVDLRAARTLPEETAAREEWSAAVGHGLALVREAIHRLTLARLHVRANGPAAPETSVIGQIIENIYRAVTWLAGTLQAWGIALVRIHNAAPGPDGGA